MYATNPYANFFFSTEEEDPQDIVEIYRKERLGVIQPMTNNSFTSQIAAQKQKDFGKLTAMVLDHIRNSGIAGLTRGELCEILNKQQNSLTGPLKTLEKMGLIGTNGTSRIWKLTGFKQQVYFSSRYLK